MNVKRLTEAQAKLHANCDAALAEGLIVDIDELVGVEVTLEALEALSACRALLEKYEWAGKTTSKEKKVFDDVPRKCCLECRYEKVAHRGKHASVCAWDAALQGVGGE